MSAMVYLKQNVRLELENHKEEIKLFKTEFQLSAAEIVPVSNQSSSDVELAKQLKLLFCDRNVKSVGNLKFTVNLYFFKKVSEEPKNRIGYFVNATGNWLKILNQIYPSKREDLVSVFKIDVQRKVSGESSTKRRPGSLEEVVQLNPTIPLSTSSGTCTGQLLKEFPEDIKCKELWLKLIFCPLPTPFDFKDMQQSWFFPFFLGRAYSFTPASKLIADGRRQDVQNGKTADLVIVADSGNQWDAYQEYFVAGSPVFRSMLETEGFKEQQTKRVNIPEFRDAVIENLLKYLHYFDMDELNNSLDLAIDMLQCAERYQVDELKNGILDMLLNRPSKDFGIGELLKLYTYTKNLEHLQGLSIKVVMALKDKVKELGKSEEFKDFFDSEPDSARELFMLTLETEEVRQKI